MVISNYTFEEMLGMIEINELIGHKIIPGKNDYYDYLDKLQDRIRKKEKFWNSEIPLFYFYAQTGLGLENAFIHGKKPVILNAFRGEKGIIIRIEDCGEGFNFKKVQKNYMQRTKYFKNKGMGFESYNKNGYLVSFENKGRTLNMLYFFNQKDLEQKLGEER